MTDSDKSQMNRLAHAPMAGSLYPDSPDPDIITLVAQCNLGKVKFPSPV